MGSVFLPDGMTTVGDTLLANNLSNTDAEYERVLRLIEEANPSIAAPLQCTMPDEPILIPGGHKLEPLEKANYAVFRDSYRVASKDSKNVLQEIATDCQQFYEMLAISEWVAQNFGEYSAMSGVADTNTGIGGVGVMVEARGQQILQQLRELDAMLVRYASANAVDKSALKQKIKTKYTDLHGRFGRELNRITGGIKSNVRQSPLLNANNAMKIATGQSSGARTIPLTGAKETKNLMKVLKGARVIGKGVVLVDLGFRVNNVRMQPTMEGKIRQATIEASGFAFSAALAMNVGQAIAPIILVNPVLGILLLIVVGAGAAIAGDYLGKMLGATAWDNAYQYGQVIIR